jgi:hypothetical protein
LRDIIHGEDKVAAWSNLNDSKKEEVIGLVVRKIGTNFHSFDGLKLEEKYHYTYMDCLISYTLDRWEVLNRGLY